MEVNSILELAWERISDSEDIQKGTYTLVKEEAIKVLNNDNFKITSKGNQKIYSVSIKTDIPMEDGTLSSYSTLTR